MKPGLSSCRLAALAGAATLVFRCGIAGATPVLLADGNATLTIDPNSSAGASSWTVDGRNQLNQQWFWYSANGSPAAPIHTIGSASVRQFSPNLVSITYANAALSVEVRYLLSGGSFGSGTAGLVQGIRVLNLSGTPLSVQFLDFAEYALGGSGSGMVQVAADFSEALVTGGDGSFVSTGAVVPRAGYGAAGVNADVLDGLSGHLSGPLGPIAGGAFALEWNTVLPDRGSYVLSIPIGIEGVRRVPETGTSWTLILALITCGTMRRRWCH